MKLSEMTTFREQFDEWMKDPAFKAEYDALAPEFELASALIEKRLKRKKKIGTKQSWLSVSVPVSVFKEGKTYVAYSPIVDLSSCGKTHQEAEKRFREAVHLFFEEMLKRGTLKEVLKGLGWTKTKKSWQPPTLVAHTTETVKVPA